MSVQPFTPSGVSAKQAELNALSSSDRQTQANLIKSDLKNWVADNFTLDTAQQTYLDGISDEFIELASALTGFAVENELPISLSVTGTPTTFKLIHLSNNITCDYSPDGTTTSGSLIYTITYE